VVPTATRETQIARLKSGHFDALILGGGINGAGIARDLALRAAETGHPLAVALVEQGHFASGTSSRNSQLIHGGLRYLKTLEFHLVREALRERAALLRLAPGYVQPLRFLLPLYGWFGRFYYGAGL
jgi:glycerol-3-phosphate dehydrogenase